MSKWLNSIRKNSRKSPCPYLQLCTEFQILVSHHVELLLPSANYIVRILDGRIDAQGTPEDLQARGELDGLVISEETEVAKAEPIVSDEIVEKEVKAVEDGVNGENGENGEAKKEKKKKGPGKKYVQDEERQIGNVKWATYKLYIVAATYTTWIWSVIVLGQSFLHRILKFVLIL